MRSVEINALQERLSEYVRLAAGGETILIVDGQAVVAELRPPRVSLAERAFAGPSARAGRSDRGGLPRSGEGPPPRLPLAPLDELLAELDADRDAR